MGRGAPRLTMPAPVLLPRLLSASSAAAYLGMSESKLRTLGLPRRVCGGNRLYDRHDLDRFAESLAYEGEGEAEAAKWDEAFGCAT